MKILKLLAVLWCAVIMSVSFTSCSKDDDDDDDKEDSLIVGTWRDSYDDDWDEITFSKDGSFTWTWYEEKYGTTDVSTGTYTYKHPKLTLIYDEDEMYDDGEKEVYIVKSISSSELVLYLELEDATMTYSKK